MDTLVGKVAIVTGTSSGIGEAIAEKLVETGLKVVGVARRKEKQDELAKKLVSKKGKFFSFVGDVSKEEDILAVFKWTKENVGPVSILINNAGIYRELSFTECSTKDIQDTLNINLLAICIASKEAIKQMKENNIDGHIINVNSIAGHKLLDIPNLNIYPASKCAVLVFNGTLRRELAIQGSKIKITSLSPGVVMSEMLTNSLDKRTQEEKDQLNIPYLNAADIAEATLYILSTPAHVQISEMTIRHVEEKY